jgi:hypothetical protein
MLSARHIFLSLLVFIFSSNLSFGESARFDLKGMYIGMSKTDFLEHTKNFEMETYGPNNLPVYPSFPLADITTAMFPEFIGEELHSLLFMLDSKKFTDLYLAISKKYPDIECKESAIQNRMGAVFTQVECVLEDEISELFLKRYASDLDTSILRLDSFKYLEHKDKKSKISDDI